MKKTELLFLFRYLKQSPLFLIGLIFFSILCAITTVIAPLMIGKLIDQLTTSSANWLFFSLAIVYLFLFLANSMIAFCLSKLIGYVTQKIREDLFSKLHKLPLSSLDQTSSGNVINTFSVDVDNIANGLFPSISRIIVGIISVFLALYFMLGIHKILSLILILCAPLMYYLSKFITKNTNQYFEKRAELVSSLNGYTQDIFSHQKLIKDYAFENQSIAAFEKKNKDLYTIGKKAQFYSSLSNPATRFISNLSYILVGIFGIWFCLTGQITVGGLSSFLLFTSVFTRPFQEITSMISEIQVSLASAKRIFTFLQESDEKEDSTPFPITHLQGEIQWKDVSFSYVKEKPFICDLNLTIKKGEKVAIVGKTGCGKTTLVNLLMRFYDIDQGKILLDGINIQSMPKKFLRENIGMVLQDTKLFTGTIKENIAYGKPDATESEIKHAAKLAMADSFIQRLPKGYDTFLSSQNSLSAGEIQLLTIARILLLHPPIVILDEATSNVDLMTEANIQNAILKVIHHSTSIIIAHRLSTILKADRILYMEDGAIVEEGTHQELLAKKGKYHNLYHSQFH